LPRLFAMAVLARVPAKTQEELLAGMTKPSTTAHDFPSMHVKPPGVQAGLAALQRGLAIDLMLATLLLAVTALVLLPGALDLPMEVWDESRVANSAIEMAIHGGWTVTTFGGVPDHWELKPPLLVWMMAALLRTDMDPMLAIRLPTILSTMGSVLLVYASCRVLLVDRLAGLIGGLLVACSVLFMGNHVGRTGDYDAVLCFLTLGFVICAGRYIDQQTIDGQAREPRLWIAAAAVLLVLAIMTKSVAGGLTVPGIIAYAVARRRLFAVLADWWAWLSVAGAAVVVAGWFVLREQLDPGYLAAVWNYDIAGTMLTVLEEHHGGPAYYAWILLRGFEPAIMLSPTLLVMPRDADPKRRRLCLLTALAALSCLVVIGFARTKLYWYAAPVVPLAAVAIGVSSSTWLRGAGSWPKSIRLRSAVVGVPILLALAASFWILNVRQPGIYYAPDQARYGPFMARLRDFHALDDLIIVDGGIPNSAGLRHYSPVAKFFVEDAERRGDHMRLLATTADLPVNAFVLSCDPHIRQWLASQDSFVTMLSNDHCVFGHLPGTSGHHVAVE
jgi:4-amino-4-deoxy-L-arabinose transferase-like glycosyltransferase